MKMVMAKLKQVCITTRDGEGLMIEATLQRQNIAAYIQQIMQSPHNDVETDDAVLLHFVKKILPDFAEQLRKPSKHENMPRIENGVLWANHNDFALFYWVFEEDGTRIIVQWYNISEIHEWQPDPAPIVLPS